MKKIALALVCVTIIGLVPNWEHQIKQLDKLQVLGQDRASISDVKASPELASLVEKPVLTAKSALVYDHSSGSILFSLDFDKKLPVASLTKLISALVILDVVGMDEVIEITEADTKVIGANTGLIAGERLRASELLKAMLISSHNDSTLALTRHAGGSIGNFVALMNAKAKTLGLTESNFTNPIGFDDVNHYSTAKDLALILQKCLENETINDIVKMKEAEIRSENFAFTHKIKTTNKLLLEDASVVGVKTGYTTEAKGNLVVRSVKNGGDVVSIILGSDDREGDSRKVLDWVFTSYRW